MIIIDILLICALSLLTYFQIREHKVRSFMKRVMFSEYLRAKDMQRRGELDIFTMGSIWNISKRMKMWRLILSFRPLKYKNYIFPDELTSIGPYLAATDAKVAAGEELIPHDDSTGPEDENAI